MENIIWQNFIATVNKIEDTLKGTLKKVPFLNLLSNIACIKFQTKLDAIY